MKNNAIHMVKSAFLMQFRTTMENCGVSPDHYFKKVNLPTEVDDPESLLPVKPFFQLINVVAISEDIPDFGSLVAQTTPWHKVSSLAPLIKNSENLGDLLETFCEIASSQSSHVNFTLIDKNSQHYFCFKDTPVYKGDIQMELYRITCMIQLVQLAAGAEWRPETIRLNMPHTPVVNASSLLSESEIGFSQADSAISIQGDLLQLPVQLEIPARIHTGNNIHAASNIEFSNSIRQIIKSYLPTTNISIEDVARIADMSVRTLQRRLKASNLNFKELLNHAKLAHAKEKLHDTRMPIAKIAESLGYSDTAHFTRAFKRMSGMSPSEYRLSL